MQNNRLQDIKRVGLTQNVVRLYFIDMLKALYYCHKVTKVIHRDIKPDNIGINHNGEAILIDFGVSAEFENEDDTMESNMGSYMFFAPEMFQRSNKEIKIRGEKTDLWALGITIYYLLTGRFHCEDATNPIHLKELICEREINFDLIKHERSKKLLQQMLMKDPEKRIELE